MSDKEEKKQRALDIYLDSVCIENNYRPISFQALSDKLMEEGLNVSQSTLQRWSIEHNWKEQAQNKAKNLSNKEVAKNISPTQAQAIENVEKIVGVSSSVLLNYVNDVASRGSKNVKEIELVLKIMVANASLITKPLERQTDDRVSAIEILQTLKEKNEDDFIDAEVE